MPEISSSLTNPTDDLHVSVWRIDEPAAFFSIFPNSWSMPPIQANVQAKKYLESLAARYCLWILMQKLALQDCALQQDGRQRPFLNHPDWQISISHSYPFAAACMSKKTFVGIDLEKKGRKVQKIAPRFLNPIEFHAWKDDLLTLTLAWSAKESIYKAWKKPGLSFQKEIGLTFNNEVLSGKVNQKEAFGIQYELFDDFIITLVNH
jgi:4'-phosphopantetheinyl transferase EntD